MLAKQESKSRMNEVIMEENFKKAKEGKEIYLWNRIKESRKEDLQKIGNRKN
jgi:hypothetical protein